MVTAMNIRYRMWLRTLRFVASNWLVPFLLGMAAAMFIQADHAVELAEAIVRVCQQSFNTPTDGQ